jgi:hypothetical protein
MYIFKSVYNSYKRLVFHALKAEPGEVKCKFYFRTEEVQWYCWMFVPIFCRRCDAATVLQRKSPKEEKPVNRETVTVSTTTTTLVAFPGEV